MMNNTLTSLAEYRGNVSQLEQKRAQLCSALRQAWSRDNYKAVIPLVADLAYLVGRLPRDDDEHILLLGIQACRYLHDFQQLAQFLNRLAGLLCTQDRFEQALLAWQESAQVAQGLGYPFLLWEPFYQVAHITDLLGAYNLAQSFTEQLVHTSKTDNARSIALALFVRAFYARNHGDKDDAYTDLMACLHLLSDAHVYSTTSPYEHFFALVVQTELARTHSAYKDAKGYAEAAIALARTFCDPYTVSALLIDQVYFAYQQGMFRDAYLFAQQLLDLTDPIPAAYHSKSGQYMLGLLAHQSQEFRVILSTREGQILQLVAEGLSNKDIADALTITVGTVKKHIEHMYIKLDARNRTHAVAKARALNILP